MDDKVAYWASVALAALSLLLLITNVALINSNRNLQIEVNQRAAMINNATKLSNVNQALVQALADASVAEGDKDLRDLLAGQGITIKKNAKAE